MKARKIHLAVDQIGGNGSLSANDEKMISQYIQSQKKDIHPIKKRAIEAKTKNP